MGVSSCLRGYFIARRKAASPSRAQIFEQIVRIGVVVFLIDRFAVLEMCIRDSPHPGPPVPWLQLPGPGVGFPLRPDDQPV